MLTHTLKYQHTKSPIVHHHIPTYIDVLVDFMLVDARVQSSFESFSVFVLTFHVGALSIVHKRIDPEPTFPSGYDTSKRLNASGYNLLEWDGSFGVGIQYSLVQFINFRCFLDVYEDVTVLLRLQLSNSLVFCSFSISLLGEDNDLIQNTTGIGHIIIPILKLKGITNYWA